jgi:cystathionine gamma-synthase
MVLSTANESRDLLTDPLWRESDLGKPMPDSPHGVSVTLPLWQHVVAYEEGDTNVTSKMALGYPRFVFHPFAQRLFKLCEQRFAKEGESCLALPSWRVAVHCAEFIKGRSGQSARIDQFDQTPVHVVTFPTTAAEAAKHFWQHFGEIVSSRQADAITLRRLPSLDESGTKCALRERIAGWSGAYADDVYLYPTGMAALASAQRLCHHIVPDTKSIQFGFSYVDLLKIQEKRGPGVHFIPSIHGDGLDRLEVLLKSERACGLFCEFPSNPLLESCDLERVASLLRKYDVPLIVDETLGTFLNVDVLSIADVVMTSLTKYVSGTGDVMGGSLILNRQSPFYDRLCAALAQDYEDLYWVEDAAALELNSRDFIERMRRINVNTERICDHLSSHSRVENVRYPKYTCRREYDARKRVNAGFGGLFSVVTKDAARTAARFFDALRICKGPSLGNNFSLACPFTLLAHYKELDWAEELGVSRYLVRVSIGLEEPEDLIGRFDEALDFGSRP